MKTEKQIAQENISLLKSRMQTFETKARRSGFCNSHKATCQRFLEFLELHNKGLKFVWEKVKGLGEFNQWQNMEHKITDLKQAIKLYNEAGI